MINFIGKHVLEQIKEGSAGGAPPPATPPPADPKVQQSPASGAPPVETKGTETDQFGYPVDPKPGDPPPADPKAGDPPKELDPKELKENSTGYDLGDKKIEVPPAPPESPKDPPPPPTEFDKKFDKLPKAIADEAKAEAKDLGLEGDKLDKFVARREAMVARNTENQKNFERQQEANVQRQRATWSNELREHPTFGGQNFKTNIVKAQKVLDDVLPETKKILTESKTMLPPYVMRDLASLYDRLHKVGTFVHGDPPAPPSPPPKDKLSEALEFYQ